MTAIDQAKTQQFKMNGSALENIISDANVRGGLQNFSLARRLIVRFDILFYSNGLRTSAIRSIPSTQVLDGN